MAKSPTHPKPATVADCLAHLQRTARLFRTKSDAGAAIAWAQAEIMIGDLLSAQTAQATTDPAADHVTA